MKVSGPQNPADLRCGRPFMRRRQLDWNQQPPNQNWGIPNCTIQIFGVVDALSNQLPVASRQFPVESITEITTEEPERTEESDSEFPLCSSVYSVVQDFTFDLTGNRQLATGSRSSGNWKPRLRYNIS